MNQQGVEQVIREVFGNVKTELINGWVSLQCPLAQWTHARGHDNSASAGISVHDNSVSVFNCFTCGNKSPLQGMLRKWSNYTGENLDGLIEELEEEAYLGPKTLPEWDEKHSEEIERVPLKKSVYLGLYDSAEGHPYLRKRGISKATANRLQLMLDPSDPIDGEERILFPVFGEDGELYGLSGRATNAGARLKVRDYYGLRKAANLLGAHLIAHERPSRILVVEGLFDYANAWECGQPATAVMHSTLTAAQARILQEFGLPCYGFYDNDLAGDKGNAALCNQLHQHVPVMLPAWPDTWIEDSTEKDGGHWLKDPGDLLAEEFQEMIDHAELYVPPPPKYRGRR